MIRPLCRVLVVVTVSLALDRSAGAFDLQLYIDDPGGSFGPAQLTVLNDAIARTERIWETIITGYQPGVGIASVPIAIYPVNVGLAAANYTSTTFQGGYWLATSGFVNVNSNEVLNFANWQGPGANGRNYIDELLAHEVGHVLGIGTLWDDNGLYLQGTHRYTGAHGLAAYRTEFDSAALWVPVENAGNPGTPDSHWDQRMRSSQQEGNPADPWSLDPRVGVVDGYGRDRALELMTGAIDPDYGEPFISRFGVEAMRDLGYTVAAFEDFNGDGVVNLADRDILLANFGATGLEVDSIALGDANRDRRVDAADLTLWRAAVPEPSNLLLAGLAAAVCLRFGRRR